MKQNVIVAEPLASIQLYGGLVAGLLLLLVVVVVIKGRPSSSPGKDDGIMIMTTKECPA